MSICRKDGQENGAVVKRVYWGIGIVNRLMILKRERKENNMKRNRAVAFFIIVALFILTAFVLTGCGSKTINLNSYLTYEIQGYDGYGSVATYFDSTAFEDDLAKALGLTAETANLEDLGKGLVVEMAADSGSWDKSKNLSNGDTITYDWVIDVETIKKTTGITLKWSKVTEKISGLTEAPVFNPFDYIEVSFSGVSPNGIVTITPDSNQKEMDSIVFSAEPEIGLKNGDTITVTASVLGSLDSFAEKYGNIPSITEKEYTVESLAAYISSVDDISDDLMGKMISQGEDAFRAYTAREWDKPENLISVKYIGNYLLTVKPSMTVDPRNALFLVYKIQATNPDPEQLVEFYYYVRFDNIIKLEDGTNSVDLSNYTVPKSGWSYSETFEVGKYVYKGYETIESLFNSIIVTNIETYEYSNNLEE